MLFRSAKLMAKALSSRLAPAITQLVGPHQSAFIRGRCLHDNFQLVQQTARKLNSLRRDAVMFKLDITKAFDTVDWAFLLEVLTKVGDVGITLRLPDIGLPCSGSRWAVSRIA